MKSEHRKELVSEIRSLAQSQGLNTVFTTFLEITANSLAAQTDPENAEKREQRYQEMTSTVLRTEKISAQEICFETVNTNYHLHVKQEVSA